MAYVYFGDHVSCSPCLRVRVSLIVGFPVPKKQKTSHQPPHQQPPTPGTPGAPAPAGMVPQTPGVAPGIPGLAPGMMVHPSRLGMVPGAMPGAPGVMPLPGMLRGPPAPGMPNGVPLPFSPFGMPPPGAPRCVVCTSCSDVFIRERIFFFYIE